MLASLAAACQATQVRDSPSPHTAPLPSDSSCLPHVCLYGLQAFTASLRHELRPLGLHVSTVVAPISPQDPVNIRDIRGASHNPVCESWMTDTKARVLTPRLLLPSCQTRCCSHGPVWTTAVVVRTTVATVTCVRRCGSPGLRPASTRSTPCTSQRLEHPRVLIVRGVGKSVSV